MDIKLLMRKKDEEFPGIAELEWRLLRRRERRMWLFIGGVLLAGALAVLAEIFEVA